MKENLRKYGIIGLIIIFLIALGVISFVPKNEEKPPVVFYQPTPMPTLGNPESPDFKSPYAFDENYTGVVMNVWNKNLRIDYLNITSSNYPNVTFIQSVHQEDVVRVTLPRQNLGMDTSKVKLLIVAHENMKDPYVTHISDYNILIESSFVETPQGTLETEFMLGYDKTLGSFIDILLVYNDNIEAFTMLRLDKTQKYSRMFYEWLKPNNIVNEMTFKADDKEFTFYYYPDEATNLYDWVASSSNPQKWVQIGDIITNADASWYITPEQCRQTLKNNIIIDVKPITQETNPFASYIFDTHNPQYLISYLNKDVNTVINRFGTPKNIQTFANIVKIQYDKSIFYIDNKEGVIQIDIQPNAHSIVNGLPFIPTTANDIFTTCRRLNIPYLSIQDKSDIQLKYYVKILPIKVDKNYISYVWESSLQLSPHFDNCNRIVIHSGEQYIY